MTNFDYLKEEAQFSSFADDAIAAEKILQIDAGACALNCRRTLEAAVKWMYSVDVELSMPWDDNLASLIKSDDFKAIVDDSLFPRIDFIRQVGNRAAHPNGKKVTRDQAELCLENLFAFLDFVACCYADNYTERTFDRSLLKPQASKEQAKEIVKEIIKEVPVVREVIKEVPVVKEVIKEIPTVPVELERKLADLIKQNEALQAELTARRAEHQAAYVPKPLDISEYETRKVYIDTMLQDAGWTEGKDWLDEYELHGMPSASGIGYADYALMGADGRILAIVEAKKTCVDVSKGRQQAKLYADIIEKKQGRRPVIFLTNGFETRIIDGQYQERVCSSIYSRRDLERLFNLRRMRKSLKYVTIDKHICERYYQEEAIKAVCESFDAGNRRKALLVMATGSGKTRTVMALCKVLQEKGWASNILFLADRNSLVTQAKRAFVNMMPDLSLTNLCEDKDNFGAHMVFSTYQTMINCIDTVADEEGRLFTCGHFDLIICDEAHRSIYNKFKDIFRYFDAPLVGLTATPKDEIDKNTYDEFELEDGIPTYGYTMAQAVKDGYLVDFTSVESQLNFLTNGIEYDKLSPEERKRYEELFEKTGELPDCIDADALNSWLFNEDTIVKVLDIVMTKGIKIDYGSKIGKTVIFAKSHKHAEKILEIFNKQYPHLVGYARVIDNYMTYAQSAIDEFSDPKKLPQIAISVDMLDTGIDVPEIVNLVFFKKVMSKAKFWQMIGRGTRLCPGLIDGKDKDKFYIFDFCGNFAYFRIKDGEDVPIMVSMQSAIFTLKFELAFKLQESIWQTEPLIALRKKLVDYMVNKVRELDKDNFAVKLHMKYVELYANPDNYQSLKYEDTLKVREELAPLMNPDKDNAKALRFDVLIYRLELAYLCGKSYRSGQRELKKKAADVASVCSIPAVAQEKELLDKVVHTDYVEEADVETLEYIREHLRDLMQYIPTGRPIFETNFKDDILSIDWHDPELPEELKNYREKAERYIRANVDRTAIQKLRENIPLNTADIRELEQILWEEAGTKEDYEAEYGSKPLGELVREVVGLDMAAAKAAFAQYLDESRMNSSQIYFVNQIIEFIVQNGMMKDLSVLKDAPFTQYGSVIQVFKNNMTAWQGIAGTIQQINANANAA